MKFPFYILSAILLIFVACEEASLEEEKGLDWDIGKNEYNVELGGAERNFLLHIPASYDGSVEVPVVFMLHGSSGNGQKFYNISRWVEKSEEEGFIAVFPTAREYPVLPSGRLTTKWASGGLINDVVPGTEIKDDVPFFEELVELLGETFEIDEKRLYISGFSNGGGFVKSVIAAEMGDVFAAASSSGGVGVPIEFSAIQGRIIPFHNISGSLDDRIMESIGVMAEIPIKGEDLEAHDYLWSSIVNMTKLLSLSEVYTEEATLPQFNTLTFSDDLTGQGNEYVLVIIKDLMHNYANEGNNPRGVVAVDLIWPWFQKWTLE